MPSSSQNEPRTSTPGTAAASSIGTGNIPPQPGSSSPPTPSSRPHGEPGGLSSSFTADSPYFSSYIDTEMQSLNVLHDTVKDISARAKTFGKCGALMAEATRRLSQACRLQPSGAAAAAVPLHRRLMVWMRKPGRRRERPRRSGRMPSGEEMESVLRVLGGVSVLCFILFI